MRHTKNFVEVLNKTLDSHGFIVQRAPGWYPEYAPISGGDTAHKMGHFWFLSILNYEMGEVDLVRDINDSQTMGYVGINDLEPIPGCFVRYPQYDDIDDPGSTYCENTWKGVMSRDQMTALLVAMGINKDYKRIFITFLRHILRGCLFMSNSVEFDSKVVSLDLDLKTGKQVPKYEHTQKKRLPGFGFLEYFNLFLRGLPALGYLLYPLVCLFDLETLGGSIMIRYFQKEKVDVANHCSVCIYGMQRVPTPIMYLANKINSHSDMMERHKKYWDRDAYWRLQGFMVDMFDAPMRKYFSK